MTDSIIEQVKDRSRLMGADEHIAQITGERRVHKSTFYWNKNTGDEYSLICGGIGWPRDPKEKPGFLVVVAVDRTIDGKPTMRVLDEAEAPTVEALLKECVRLQKRYGHEECPDLFRFWYGDPERADTFTNLFNYGQDSKKDPDRVYVAAPYDFERPNAFERYCHQVWDSLMPDPTTGEKRLFLDACVKLRNHIQNTPGEAATKGDLKDYPAIFALGGVVHSLMMLQPWFAFSNPERTVHTIQDDPLAAQQEDMERVLWEEETGSPDYGEMDEYDNGQLVGTV